MWTQRKVEKPICGWLDFDTALPPANPPIRNLHFLVVGAMGDWPIAGSRVAKRFLQDSPFFPSLELSSVSKEALKKFVQIE